MARWLPRPLEELPEHLSHFRAADWLADLDAADADYDVWADRKWYERPRTDNEALRAAYADYMAARDAWEAAHPEFRRRQVAELVERRVARRAEQEKRWRERGDRHAGRSPGPLHFRRHEHDD